MEAQRLLNRRTLALFLLCSILSLYFIQTGISDYKKNAENKKNFLNIEQLKVNQYINYAQYGAYGFRILFIPSPLSILFTNSSVISDLTSNVDSGERLNIYDSFKGRRLFAEKLGGFKDFSGIMLLLGSLLVLYIGYESLIHKDYLRFMVGITGRKALFLSIVFSRVMVFVLFFILNGLLALLLLELNGFRLTQAECIHFLVYLSVLVVVSIFFFALGTIAGAFKSIFAGFVTLITAWFSLVFLIPGIVGGITAGNAGGIMSNYQLELDKLTTLMGFEKRAIERAGRLTEPKTDDERELMESYWDKEVKELNASELKLQAEIEKNIHRFQTLSYLFPSTFYLATGSEISSKGYESFLHFFEYIREVKQAFVRFVIDKRYYSNFSKVESFIKKDENLFLSASRLPSGFIKGLLLTLLYTLILFGLSYYHFRKSLKR